jgi:uncharacterized protein (DUF2141 family)
MYKKIILILLTLSINYSLIAEGNLGTLTVKVSGLRNTNGYVVCHLFNSADGYPTKSKKAIKFIDDYNIKNKTATFVFTNLPYGNYAFTVHHDENANHKMDKNFFGLPSEGWACSNNAKGTLGLGLPSFDKAKIVVNKSEVTTYVIMNY